MQRLLGHADGRRNDPAARASSRRRLAGDRAGLLAAGIAAAYPDLVAADGALMTESLFGALAAGMLLAALRLADAPGTGRAAVLGVVAGVAALARSEALLLLPLVLLRCCAGPGGLRAGRGRHGRRSPRSSSRPGRCATGRVRPPVLVATEGAARRSRRELQPVYHGENLGAGRVRAWLPPSPA